MRRAGYDPRHSRAPRRRATARATRRRPLSARARLGITLPVLTLAAAGFAACPLSRPATPPQSSTPPSPVAAPAAPPAGGRPLPVTLTPTVRRLGPPPPRRRGKAGDGRQGA